MIRSEHSSKSSGTRMRVSRWMLLNFVALLSVLSAETYAQCSGGTSAGALAAITTTYQTVSINAGTYRTFSATAGIIYNFTFCSNGAAASYDTQITILDSFGAAVPNGYDDDTCGNKANIAWTPSLSGTYRVLISNYNCLSSGVAATLAFGILAPQSLGGRFAGWGTAKSLATPLTNIFSGGSTAGWSSAKTLSTPLANIYSGGTEGGWTTAASVVISAPPVASTYLPADNATGIAVAANLVLTFSENIQKGTGNILIKANGVTVQTIPVTDASVTVAGATLTINPGDFTSSTAINVEIAAGAIKDLLNNNYAGITDATTWNFTTVDVTAPTATTFTPLDNATGVIQNSDLIILFSEPIQKGTGNIIIKEAGVTTQTIPVGDAAVTITGSTATINPTNFSNNAAVNVEMAAGVFKDMSNNNYAGLTTATAWNFTAAAVVLPNITSITPNSATIGTQVVIAGTNFSATPANNTVKFNNVTATATASTTTSITVNVPAGASTGPVTVTVSAQTATSPSSFTVIPTISGFNPNSGPIGTPVTISGTAFDPVAANNTVKFNNVVAVATASTTTSITTTVPASATTGPVTVTVGTETATGANFTVTAATAPTITGFNPPNGAEGVPVTITGTNFSNVPADNVVSFNGQQATVTASNATTITTSVPTGATTGPISVTVSGQTATSSTNFTVDGILPVVISAEVLPSSYNKGESMTVSITVNDAARVSKVNLKRRGISEASTATKTEEITASGNKYEKQIPASELNDPIGVTYYFEVFDMAQVEKESAIGKAYLKYPATSTDQALPNLSFGNQVSNYQIIAVPLQLTNKAASSVFSSLMPYDNTKWRLFDFASGDNREYPGFTNIDPGKGYWLIVKNSTTINPGEGSTVQGDDTNPFTIDLAAGWNLIGNPYNFRVSWTDILAANSNPAGVGTSLQLFSSGTLSDGTVLERFRGGFAFNNTTGVIKLKIPPVRNTTLGAGRIAGGQTDLTAPDWQLRMTLTDGVLTNEVGGIGMHPRATLTAKDDFDVVSIPFPDGLNLFELTFAHPELNTSFNREIVPTQGQYTWEMAVKKSSDSDVHIRWTDGIITDDRELVLFNPATLEVIDMIERNGYTVSSKDTKLLVLYGSDDYIKSRLEGGFPLTGEPFPNPADNQVTIPFRIANTSSFETVSIKAFNSSGTMIANIVDGSYGPGTHAVRWHTDHSAGLYLIKVIVGSKEEKTFKVMLK